MCGIGETGRPMQERIKEHDRDTRLIRTQTSAIFEHTHETSHYPIWNKVKFTDWDPHWYTRRVKEAIHIKIHPNNINRDRELKFLKRGCPQSKNTTGKQYNSGPLREQLLAKTVGESKCTSHSHPLWYKWCHVISRPQRLKKSSSKQLKRCDLHLNRLHRETNNNTLYYSIYHDEQQQPFPRQNVYFSIRKELKLEKIQRAL